MTYGPWPRRADLRERHDRFSALSLSPEVSIRPYRSSMYASVMA